jgi:hypothetical protein
LNHLAQAITCRLDRDWRLETRTEDLDRLGKRPQLWIAQRLLLGEIIDGALDVLSGRLGDLGIEPWHQRGQGSRVADELERIAWSELVAGDIAHALLRDLPGVLRPAQADRTRDRLRFVAELAKQLMIIGQLTDERHTHFLILLRQIP